MDPTKLRYSFLNVTSLFKHDDDDLLIKILIFSTAEASSPFSSSSPLSPLIRNNEKIVTTLQQYSVTN